MKIVTNPSRGIVTTLSLLVFSSAIGSRIDQSSSRLRSLVSSIVVNRVTILVACAIWVFLVDNHQDSATLRQRERTLLDGLNVSHASLKHSLFAVVLLLGILERLSGVANMLSMERDWVPAIAAGPEHHGVGSLTLTHLNAVMRRIDLTCKLMAPLLISFLVSALDSVKVGAMAVGIMSGLSWGLEWFCAYQVWKKNPALRHPKQRSEHGTAHHAPSHLGFGLWSASLDWVRAQSKHLKLYFSTPVWMPSVALSILYFSSLSYSATFITYLLNAGFSLNLIAVARTFGSFVEISATVVAPWAIVTLSTYNSQYMRLQGIDSVHDDAGAEEGHAFLAAAVPGPKDDGKSSGAGLERLGLWGLWLQFSNLVPVLLTLLVIRSSTSSDPAASSFNSPCRHCPRSPSSHSCLFPGWVSGSRTSPVPRSHRRWSRLRGDRRSPVPRRNSSPSSSCCSGSLPPPSARRSSSRSLPAWVWHLWV